ncbi:MAG TPA: amidohydrolase family protein, partial [Alphaproteobacteria bacterium]|nr:amidohydrolase family protein [Alphaproteobacteria bacterium]
MHDLVIRGGTIVDGTGAKGYIGDVAIDGERIASVGGKAGPGKGEIDADGLLVTPGWVDVHTHYDGQATWDPELAPSSWQGVTTILFGNCGVGFAPCRPQDRDALVDLMEGVEDIPGIVLNEGLKWDWESFPEFLDALERQPRAIDVGAQMPHHPLRVYVMGERAINFEDATPDDIAEMRRLTEEALKAGAFGFTTSRTESHRTTQGERVPARYAQAEELIGIGQAFRTVDHGAYGMLNDFEDEAAEFDWITRVGKETGRPLWFLMTDRYSDPQRWRRLMGGVHQARDAGANVTAQIAGRQVGVILGLSTSLTPFSGRPSFAALNGMPHKERVAILKSPEMRAKILAEENADELLSKLPPLQRAIASRWDRMYILDDPPEYEPKPEAAVETAARLAGKEPQEFVYDFLTEGDGGGMILFPVTNFVTGDLEPVHEMMQDPATIIGLGDGGAHCGQICDASMPTFMITHWTRDRTRGDKFPVEWAVRRLTSETADFFGFKDRGRLAPGLKADVNLIDY